MSDYPRNQVVPTFIQAWSKYSIGFAIRLVQGGASPSAQDWTANVAMYLPLYLPWSYNVRRIFCYCGNNTLSGNVDIGIYTERGGRVYSTGSTPLTGAPGSGPLYVTPATPLLLGPGAYFMAYACDTGGGGSSRAFTTGFNATQGRMMGVYQQASAFPLPAAATFAAYTGTPGVPLVGITNTSSGF
jgi:hypothetical protein